VPITEIEMHGLEKIKNDDKWIEYVSIFLNLSDEKMTERITKRWNIEEDEIGRRVSAAQEERIKAKNLCDYVLDTNDTLENNIKNLNQLVKKILNG
jgi:guanylate kinase